MKIVVNKEYIESDNKSSEWIKIDLPATVYRFIDKDAIYHQELIKIITNTGDVVWRESESKGNYNEVLPDNKMVAEFEELFFKMVTIPEREKKLKSLYENR